MQHRLEPQNVARQATEVLDHPMQVDRRRAMAELLAAERAIAALLILQPGPGGRLVRLRGVVLAVQLDPVAELMIVVEGDTVGGVGSGAVEAHEWFRQPWTDVVGTCDACGPQVVERSPGGDGDQPCLDVVDGGEFLLVESQVDVLGDVLGVGEAPGHPVGDVEQVLMMRAPDGLEGGGGGRRRRCHVQQRTSGNLDAGRSDAKPLRETRSGDLFCLFGLDQLNPSERQLGLRPGVIGAWPELISDERGHRYVARRAAGRGRRRSATGSSTRRGPAQSADEGRHAAR